MKKSLFDSLKVGDLIIYMGDVVIWRVLRIDTVSAIVARDDNPSGLLEVPKEEIDSLFESWATAAERRRVTEAKAKEKFAREQRDAYLSTINMRDQFAMAALPSVKLLNSIPPGGDRAARFIAAFAYEIADAMLAERAK